MASTPSTCVLRIDDNYTVRLWKESDAEEAAKAGDYREIWLNMTDRFPHPYTPEKAKEWIAFCKNSENWIPLHGLATIQATDKAVETHPKDFVLCHDDVPIGSCGIEYDPGKSIHTVSIGYWITKAYWGKGVATLVASALTKWIFDTFPWVLRIEADAYSWNIASQKVLQKAGFEYEGTQRMRVRKDGKYGDLVLFSKLRPGLDLVLMEVDKR